MYVVYPNDSVNTPFVLRHINKNKLIVMDEYEDLVCKECRKVDENAALSRGIQEEVVVNSKRPFLSSADGFYLVNEKIKQRLTTILPNEIGYFRIPSSAY
jgi:hypothetical protein